MDYLAKLKQLEQPSLRPGDPTVEPVKPLSPVFWQSGGRILGPGIVLQVTEGDGRFWLCIEYAGGWRWIHADLLRSHEAFERQDQRVCPCCHGTEFWQSDHVEAVCHRCHPPASASIVKGEDHAG